MNYVRLAQIYTHIPVYMSRMQIYHIPNIVTKPANAFFALMQRYPRWYENDVIMVELDKYMYLYVNIAKKI